MVLFVANIELNHANLPFDSPLILGIRSRNEQLHAPYIR